MNADTPSGAVLWLDPGFGAAGDMVLGALLGLGADADRIRTALDALAVDGWTLDHRTVTRNGLTATRAEVRCREQHHHRTWSSIDALLAGAKLPDQARAGARATFRLLGEVEAEMHGIDIDEVHFHEVGAIDAIVDIVGCWLALEQLDVDRVVAGPVGLGHGTVASAHGTLPLPAPATAALLAGAPIRPVDLAAETVTPTGAALLATMAETWGPLPTGVLRATARGAGGRDPEGHTNVITAHLVDPMPVPGPAPDVGAVGLPAAPPAGDRRATRTIAVVLETNLDDVTPEMIGHVIGRCLSAGADDAWAQPIVMKKSRPGFLLRVLGPPERTASLQSILFAETGTLGVRVSTVAKDVLDRRIANVEVRGHPVRVKVGPYGAKPEYEDLAAASRALGVPVRTLAAEALVGFETTSAEGQERRSATIDDGARAGEHRAPE